MVGVRRRVMVVVAGVLSLSGLVGVSGSASAAGSGFVDVPASSPFVTEIAWLADSGISQGWDVGGGRREFRPLSSVKRDAMAAFMYRLMGSPAFAPGASSFRDMKSSTQFFAEVQWLATRSPAVTTGYPVAGGREFRPSGSVNRDAMAAFLYRLAGEPEFVAPSVSEFADVPVGSQFYKEIHWLAASRITTGWDVGGAKPEFRPLVPVARDAMAVFLYRYDRIKPVRPTLTRLLGSGDDGRGGDSSISADGRYVAHADSRADQPWGALYLEDRVMGTTAIVADRGRTPSISADGRYVAFVAPAPTVVSGDNDENVIDPWSNDVYLWDRVTGTTTRVSLSKEGPKDLGISWRQGSLGPSISADGRYITYYSEATDLVQGDTNGTWDVFVWDRTTGSTKRVSVSSNGFQAGGSFPSISADGRYITFVSARSILGPGEHAQAGVLVVRDQVTGATELVAEMNPFGAPPAARFYGPSISGDGRFITFESFESNLVAGDTNGTWDVFVWDRVTKVTKRVSMSMDGTQRNAASSAPSISGDGRHIAYLAEGLGPYEEDPKQVAGVYMWDRVTGVTTLVAREYPWPGLQENGASRASLSFNGRYAAFDAWARAIDQSHADEERAVYVWDRGAG